jgi:hypothetical protein
MPGAQERLDFSYFEYPDIGRFEETVTALLDWARAYKAETGFFPGAFIMYFVDRTGRKYQWPQLNYGGPAGAPAWPFWTVTCMGVLLAHACSMHFMFHVTGMPCSLSVAGMKRDVPRKGQQCTQAHLSQHDMRMP